MPTILWVVTAIIVVLLWIVCRLIKCVCGKIRKAARRRRYTRKQAKLAREEAKRQEKIEQEYAREEAELERKEALFKASIAKTSIVGTRKVFDSNRKHHYETTFMIYYVDGRKAAMTVRDGSHYYDVFIGKLEE